MCLAVSKKSTMLSCKIIVNREEIIQVDSSNYLDNTATPDVIKKLRKAKKTFQDVKYSEE